MNEAQVFALLKSTIPEMHSEAWEARSFHIAERQKHHHKMLIFCHLVYTDHLHHTIEEADLVIKRYRQKNEGDLSSAALQHLWQTGFGSESPYRVPRLYGYAPEQGTLVQERAVGQTWNTLLQQDQHSAWQTAATQAAGWLVQLQRTPAHAAIPQPLSKRTPHAYLSAAPSLLQALAAAFPAFAARMERIDRDLSHRMPALQELPLVLSHGDFHAENVVSTAGWATLIDFDAYGLHEAAFDIGYCIGQLLSMSYFRCGSILPGVKSARSFWSSYASTGYAAWPHVSLEVACTLVQVLHYTLYALHADRAGMIPHWLDLIEQWLDCTSPDIFTYLMPETFSLAAL